MTCVCILYVCDLCIAWACDAIVWVLRFVSDIEFVLRGVFILFACCYSVVWRMHVCDVCGVRVG